MFNLKVTVQPEHNPLSYLNQTRFLPISILVCQHLPGHLLSFLRPVWIQSGFSSPVKGVQLREKAILETLIPS